mmetsp:Transcript_56005/g.137304  ORF Transcript_56005/g.137304 Transcript_56005/m.137304 type:complete len:209 (-) Transcript_56005:10-636(-)
MPSSSTQPAASAFSILCTCFRTDASTLWSLSALVMLPQNTTSVPYVRSLADSPGVSSSIRSCSEPAAALSRSPWPECRRECTLDGLSLSLPSCDTHFRLKYHDLSADDGRGEGLESSAVCGLLVGVADSGRDSMLAVEGRDAHTLAPLACVPVVLRDAALDCVCGRLGWLPGEKRDMKESSSRPALACLIPSCTIMPSVKSPYPAGFP